MTEARGLAIKTDAVSNGCASSAQATSPDG
jgi:hypothetical protein